MDYAIFFELKVVDVKPMVKVGRYLEISDKLSPIFVNAVGSSPDMWDGMRASDLLALITPAIDKMVSEPDYYNQFVQGDEWQSGPAIPILLPVDECVPFLGRIQSCCQQYPFATVRCEC